jgi:hypothetical protein
MDAIADYIKQNHNPDAPENRRQLSTPRTIAEKEPEPDRADFENMALRLKSAFGQKKVRIAKHNLLRRW